MQVLGQVGVVERLKDAVCEKLSLDLEGEAVNRSDISSLSCALKELGNDGYEYILKGHSLLILWFTTNKYLNFFCLFPF